MALVNKSIDSANCRQIAKVPGPSQHWLLSIRESCGRNDETRGGAGEEWGGERLHYVLCMSASNFQMRDLRDVALHFKGVRLVAVSLFQSLALSLSHFFNLSPFRLVRQLFLIIAHKNWLFGIAYGLVYVKFWYWFAPI